MRTMDKDKSIKLFQDKTIRTHWDEAQEKWFFSIADVIAVLIESPNPQTYWRVMKKRLIGDGNETVTNCSGLKMLAAGGKMRLTDVADTEQLLRVIQSIPSPKAEPFKMWLARVGSERIDETSHRPSVRNLSQKRLFTGLCLPEKVEKLRKRQEYSSKKPLEKVLSRTKRQKTLPHYRVGQMMSLSHSDYCLCR